MLSLLLLAALTQAPDCAKPCPCPKPAECSEKNCNCGAAAKLKAEIRKVACPSCGQASQCPETCRCPFPGECGHPGCACKVISGWKPVDEWRPFEANPTFEVFGREVDGVFRYTHYRRRAKGVPQVPAARTR